MRHDESRRTRFPSKRDSWLSVLLWVGAVASIAGGLSQLALAASILVRMLVLAMLLGTASLMLWVLYGTHYTFAEDELDIRSGPFRFRVPLAQVVSAEPSRNPLSSPACSLDRLLIRYGRRRILVSPEDRREFLETLARRGSGLVRKGDRVVKEGDNERGRED